MGCFQKTVVMFGERRQMHLVQDGHVVAGHVHHFHAAGEDAARTKRIIFGRKAFDIQSSCEMKRIPRLASGLGR